MNRNTLKIAQNTLNTLSMRTGKPVSEIRKEIEKAMFVGLCSQDPAVQAYWRQIPCQGEVPTPEEVIAYLALETKKRQTES